MKGISAERSNGFFDPATQTDVVCEFKDGATDVLINVIDEYDKERRTENSPLGDPTHHPFPGGEVAI